MAVTAQEVTDRYAIYNGDCIEVSPSIKDASVHVSIYSPPFAELYNYSSSEHDLSNCANYEEFLRHYEYLIEQVSRITIPGRISCVHCMDLRRPGGRGGVRDFPGDIIRMYERYGFYYMARHIIWKEPLRMAIKTRALGLRHGQLVKDSSKCHAAGADYLLVFRREGENPIPITHSEGLTYYAGSNPLPEALLAKYGNGWQVQQTNRLSQLIWQRYASSVWMDIRVKRVVEFRDGRDQEDEKHICLAEGSLVLTREHGYQPIELVEPGNRVLTHQGRWRQVLARRCNGKESTIRVCAQGVPGLIATPGHKIYAREVNGSRAKESAADSSPTWVPAANTFGSYLNLKLPPVEDNELSSEEWWVVGRWLGDGHRGTRRTSGIRGAGFGEFIISCSHQEAAGLIDRLGPHAGKINKRTATQITLRGLRHVVRETLNRCGKGAANKRLPGEAAALCQEKAEALLSGYLSADGHYVSRYNRHCASSISRALLLGMALVAMRARGVVASIYAGRPDREGIICGRDVHMSQDWIFSFRGSDGYRKSGWIDNEGSWRKVRKIEDAGDRRVWDLQVEEDESFTAEGCVVHNCPLQLDVIERCLTLYSNPGEVLFTPFMGVGSEVCGALQYGRRAIGIELKESYFRQAVKNIHRTLETPTTGAHDLFSQGEDLEEDADFDEEETEEAPA